MTYRLISQFDSFLYKRLYFVALLLAFSIFWMIAIVFTIRFLFFYFLPVPILVEQSKRFLFSIHDFEDVLKKCYFNIITTIFIVAVFAEDSVVLKSSLAKEIRKVQTTLIIDNSCFIFF